MVTLNPECPAVALKRTSDEVLAEVESFSVRYQRVGGNPEVEKIIDGLLGELRTIHSEVVGALVMHRAGLFR